MSQDRSSKTVTVFGFDNDRGQTTQDFAIGIGIFILAIAFVFAFVPTIITPFADAGGAQTAQSDRIAATIVDDLSEEESNNLSYQAFIDNYEDRESHELAKDLGLRTNLDNESFDRVNVTVQELGSNEQVTNGAGDSWDGEIGASTTRIVTMWNEDENENECDPACKLIVRVW